VRKQAHHFANLAAVVDLRNATKVAQVAHVTAAYGAHTTVSQHMTAAQRTTTTAAGTDHKHSDPNDQCCLQQLLC